MADTTANPPSLNALPSLPGTPPAAGTDKPKEKEKGNAPTDPYANLSPSDVLFELDKRGFTSVAEALQYIKRYDNAVKESELEKQKLLEIKADIEKATVTAEAREESIRQAGLKLIEDEKALDAKRKNVDERIALLTKVDPD